MIEESAPWVLDWEASTSRGERQGAGRSMRKNDEAEMATANALSAPVASLGEGKGNRRMVQ
ncbi:UNVERIFIED_CONTAM: hypothetical protein Slati_0249500 [Sesamum latifolium]|uniref:Uncharacterized protein n=1 Tax=Sesamum latifolium TaxID=2727402 RepID=A0AAW2YDA5_9LAMI